MKSKRRTQQPGKGGQDKNQHPAHLADVPQHDMADVLKSLTFLAKSKSLSFREKRMLDRAKALIISEISEVMQTTAAAIEERVNSQLEKCFMTKARNAQRAVARAATTTKAAPAKAAPRAAAAAAPARRQARAS